MSNRENLVTRIPVCGRCRQPLGPFAPPCGRLTYCVNRKEITVQNDRIWLGDLAENQNIDGVYYLRSKSLAKTKSGKPYLMLKLSDRTGQLDGRMWDNAEHYDVQVATGDFVLARARGSLWNEQMQLTVSHLETYPSDQVDPAMFLPTCPRPTEPYWQTLGKVVDALPAGGYRDICRALLEDPEWGRKLQLAPAATGVHQPYIGGLLEHVCSMLLLADKVCDHFTTLDRGLLAAGVLFHDLGKARELSYELTLDYTDEGKLIGHLVFGAELIDTFGARVGLDSRQIMLLKHLVLSHHGRPEFGTVRVPMFAEAMVLHYLDNLDAKVFGYLEAEAETIRGGWSDRKWALETAVYKVRPDAAGYQFALPLDAPPKKKTKGGEGELPLFKK
jgi:3'-5' exoribonuclease